jgi:hypothetical protein
MFVAYICGFLLQKFILLAYFIYTIYLVLPINSVNKIG